MNRVVSLSTMFALSNSGAKANKVWIIRTADIATIETAFQRTIFGALLACMVDIKTSSCEETVEDF